MVYEVELVSQASTLLDLYQRSYEQRYRTKPILAMNGTDHTFCKDLTRQLGFIKAKALIEQFLKSDHYWFIQKSHSLGSLKGNLDVVNIELAKKHQAPRAENSLDIMDPIDHGVWYFNNSDMVRDSYKLPQGAKPNDEEIRELVRKRLNL